MSIDSLAPQLSAARWRALGIACTCEHVVPGPITERLPNEPTGAIAHGTFAWMLEERLLEPRWADDRSARATDVAHELYRVYG